MKLFVYLCCALTAVLVFVRVKTLLSGFYRIPTLASLLGIVAFFVGGCHCLADPHLWPGRTR